MISDFKFYILTYGCQMNKSDSERIAGLLQRWGGQAVTGPDKADLVILNTCSVRQSAEDRVFGQVHNLVQLKKTNPRLVIAVTGCLPGRDKDGRLRKRLLGVDLYFPIFELPKLPKMLSKILNIKYSIFNVSNDSKSNNHYLDITPCYFDRFRAFIPIQTGCNNFCSYCVVPYARGQEENRPLCQILREIRSLAAKGCLEITLLGQVVNNYRAPDSENFSSKNPFKNSFAALLWEVNQIEGIRRIHSTAADPQFMSDEAIEALTLPKQMNYLHLPIQSGSNKILQKMNRRYTAEKYLQIIKKIKEKKPGIALGTDIMVGFPGETKADFQKTVDLYKKADFDIAYLAQYSPRSGTAAFKLVDNVSLKEKERRWRVLQKLMEETTRRKNQIYVGKETEVLVDYSTTATEKNLMSLKTLKFLKKKIINRGQSREMKLVEFLDDKSRLGKIAVVKIKKAETWRLKGLGIKTS